MQTPDTIFSHVTTKSFIHERFHSQLLSKSVKEFVKNWARKLTIKHSFFSTLFNIVVKNAIKWRTLSMLCIKFTYVFLSVAKRASSALNQANHFLSENELKSVGRMDGSDACRRDWIRVWSPTEHLPQVYRKGARPFSSNDSRILSFCFHRVSLLSISRYFYTPPMRDLSFDSHFFPHLIHIAAEVYESRTLCKMNAFFTAKEGNAVINSTEWNCAIFSSRKARFGQTCRIQMIGICIGCRIKFLDMMKTWLNVEMQLSSNLSCARQKQFTRASRIYALRLRRISVRVTLINHGCNYSNTSNRI